MTAITNLCPNPSFEVSLAGYAALTGATIAQDDTYAKYGSEAMLVTTDGSITGEGFTGPSSGSISSTTGAVSFYVFPLSSGNLTAEAVNWNGSVLGTVTAAVTAGSWQRVEVNGFSAPAGAGFSVLAKTTTAQALQFWVDGIQYETGVATASEYIDGDQIGCEWNGTAGLSSSTQLYPHATSASGGMVLQGRATPVAVGKQFNTSASGFMTLSGDLQDEAVSPVAAFADFAIFEAGDPDPAMTYVDVNNAGTTVNADTYTTSYGVFYPPLDYQVSSLNFAWNRAAFMGVGFYYTGVPTTESEQLTNVQVSLAPITGSDPVPAAYTTPRQVMTIIKPTRLNFCTNPSFEVSTAGWDDVAGGSVTQDNTKATNGTYSGKVSVSATGDGISMTLTDLIVGDVYTISLQAEGSSAVTGLKLVAGSDNSTTTLSATKFTTASLTFTATSSTAQVVSLEAVAGGAGDFWVDSVLIETGELVGSYFDGSFGSTGYLDYQWESGGSVGLSRSYYYEQYAVKKFSIDQILAQHTPLGLSYVEPQYLVPYTQ